MRASVKHSSRTPQPKQKLRASAIVKASHSRGKKRRIASAGGMSRQRAPSRHVTGPS